MKNIYVFLFLIAFCLNINVVSAEENSAYLISLEVEGYELSPEFDKYNNTYSLTIAEEDTYLNINYETEDENAEVQILDNKLLTEDISTVYINVTCESDKQIYKIIVNKSTSDDVAYIDDELTDLSVAKTYNMKIVVICLVGAWLLIVLVTWKILFGRKNKRLS